MGKPRLGLSSADEDLGYIYAPLSAAANDWYGGLRPGPNLFADSLSLYRRQDRQTRMALPVWVHHDLWDYDLPTAPILADLTVDGKRDESSPAGDQDGFLFAFDRVTGKPIWPIVEKPVPQTNSSDGMDVADTAFPDQARAVRSPGLTDDDLIDFTPQLHAEAVEMMKHYVHGQIFTPPSIKGEGPDGNKRDAVPARLGRWRELDRRGDRSGYRNPLRSVPFRFPILSV